MKHRRAAVWLGIALLAAGSASGETWKARNLKYTMQRAGLRLGPFRIQPVLYLTDAGFDSNIYGQTGHPVQDYWLQAGPGVSVYLPIEKKIVFSLTESPRYVYFFNTARERAWNNYLSGEVSFLFNKMFVSGGFTYNNYKFRYPFEIDIWPRLKETGAFGSLLYQVSKKTSFSMAARTTDYAFENLEAEFQDLKSRLSRREDYLTVSGYYQVTPRVMFSVGGEYGRTHFVDSAWSYGDSESWAGFGGIDFSPGGRIRGNIKLGYKKLAPLAPGRTGFEGIVGSSTLSARIFRALTVRGQYGRDVYYSAWYDNALFVGNRYGAGVSLYVINRKVRLDYDYIFNRQFYSWKGGAVPAPGGAESKISQDYQIGGVFFRLRENIGIGVRGGTYVWIYNPNSAKARRTFVGLNLTYDY
ncbi:MAG: hypothetical protein ABSF88_00765 [Candidatus Aminicenantales bacterium]